jgi:hypothetical protein
MTAVHTMTPEDARRELERLGPISPELVLVSPELRELARHALQDAVERPAPPSRRQEARSPRPPTKEARVGARPAAVAGAVAVGFVLGIAATAAWFSPTQPPRFAAPPALRADAAAPVAAPRSTPALAAPRPTRARRAEVSPAHVRSYSVPSARPRRRRTGPRPIGAPNSGYIFGREGRFTVGARRQVMGFTTEPRCGRQFTLPPMRVDRRGRFGFTGPPPDNADGARVDLHATFATPRLVRGTLRLRTNRCDTGVIRLVARLS